MAGGYVNNPSAGLFSPRYMSVPRFVANAQGYLDFGLGLATFTGRFSTKAPSPVLVNATMDELRLKVNIENSFVLSGVSFSSGNKNFVAKANGDIQTDLSPFTGNGTKVGTLAPSIGQMTLNIWEPGISPLVTNWAGVAAAPISGPDSPFGTCGVMFRTAIAPLRPGSFTILGNLMDGTTFNALADSNGKINTSRVKGRVNYQTGVVELYFTVPSPPLGTAFQDLSFLQIPGVAMVAVDLVQSDSLRYNTVAYSYLPLDAELLGIDPVRLPSDGRVPIINVGGLVVVGHSAETDSQTVANGGAINTGVTRLSRIRLIGGDGKTITGGYTVDLDAGILHVVDKTDWVQPVRVEYRIEDMALVRDAQISGDITLLSPVTHDYPVGSFVSSALTPGNLKARVPLLFDQGSWDGITFENVVTGDAATGTYNDTLAPIEVTNVGASTERFALRFTSNTSFEVIGEHVGVIGVGNINSDTAPINPATGEPYFTIRTIGWGSGWSVGNIVRINTVGALFPFWMARTVKQGPNTGLQHSTSILVRANVDRP